MINNAERKNTVLLPDTERYSDFHVLCQWLLKNGGETIRYRTAVELLDCSTASTSRYTSSDLAENEEIKVWLGYLYPTGSSMKTLHGSFNDCFENAMGKVIQLGLRAGMPALDNAIQPYLQWLRERVKAPFDNWDIFPMTIIASYLAAAGYTDDAVMNFLKKTA